MFTLKTAAHSTANTPTAINQCVMALQDQGIVEPDYLMVQADARHDLRLIADTLRQHWPDAALHAATSCLGGMTETELQVNRDAEPGLTVMALTDPDGDYASACGPLNQDPKAAAAALTREALTRADRQGEIPSLVWLTCTPGSEEEVIAGIEDVVGTGVPIVGGSAADNAIAGDWRVLADTESLAEGAVISVMFPSVGVGAAFHYGYTPTGNCGTVTEANDRRVMTIDGEPAARVYSRWTGAAMTVPEQGDTNILMASSLSPLGREMSHVQGQNIYILSHPETLAADGTMTLFTDITEGDVLTLMSGTEDTLLQRPVDVVKSACRLAEIATDQIAGMILVYCAGCMLTVRPRLAEARAGLVREFPGVPFITAFTFGEQGPILSGHNRHGNLMISSVIFSYSGD